jgi:hypothetical protein
VPRHRLAVADFKTVRAALDALAPDYPVVGRDALLAWFAAHGFPASWSTLLDWKRRAGEPFCFHGRSIGRHLGQPVSTHHILLAWMMAQSAKLAPPTYDSWVPGPRALRKRAARRRSSSPA